VLSVGKDIKREEGIHLYPNPASEVLTIMFEGINQGGKLILSDILGNTVCSADIISNLTKIDISGVSAGIYTGRITSGDQILFAGKIIIR
jgi:hypothetical protein